MGILSNCPEFEGFTWRMPDPPSNTIKKRVKKLFDKGIKSPAEIQEITGFELGDIFWVVRRLYSGELKV